MNPLQNKLAYIIGGSSGIGLAKRLAPGLVEWVMDRSIQKVQKSQNE